MCVPNRFSCVQLSATLCTVAPSPGSSLHGNLQARIMEWVVIPFSRGSFQPKDRTCLIYLPHWQAVSLPLELPGKSKKAIATSSPSARILKNQQSSKRATNDCTFSDYTIYLNFKREWENCIKKETWLLLKSIQPPNNRLRQCILPICHVMPSEISLLLLKRFSPEE